MLRKALKMNHRDAVTAVLPERTVQREQEKCSQQYVQAAAVRHVYRFSPVKTNRFIAVNALQK